MLTVAYIGFGNSVIRYHLPFIKDREYIRVKSVYRRQEDRDLSGEMDREACYPNIMFTSNLDDILNDPEIDLISINTGNDTHAMYAKAALNANKHVLVEKPFARSVKEAQEVYDLGRSKGLIVTCNNNRRYDADFLTLKKIVDSKVLGDIVEIQSHYHYFRFGAQKGPGGRGMIAGLAIHPIDQMVSLFGKPDRIHYDVRAVLTENGDDDIDIDFFYGKMKFTVKCSMCAKIDFPKFIAHGTRGSFIKNTQGHLSAHKTPEPLIVSFDVEPESNWGTLSYIDQDLKDITEKVPTEITEYGKIYDNLYDVINHKAELIVKEEQVLLILKIVEEALESIEG